MSAGHAIVVFDGDCGDCMANTKENIFPFGLNKTLQKKSKFAVYQVGCGKTSERSCVFADFDTICEATNVSVSEEEVLHLCSATYSYCQCVSECALCGSKSKHRAGNDKRVPLRLTTPGTIKVLLDEAGNFEKCLSVESVACNSCYLFSKRLQQCGEDVRSAEMIIGSLEAKVIDLKERMHTCMTSGYYY